MFTKILKSMMNPLINENGFTLILSLIMMMLLTIIAVAAINTSTTEMMITSADEDKRTAFYAADAEVNQVTARLNQGIRDRWQAVCMAVSGTRPNWNFALDGEFFPAASPQPTVTSPRWIDQYSAGVPVETGSLANGYTFDARVWNNRDAQPTSATASDAAQIDTDGLIVLGVIATSPRNSRVGIETVLNGNLNGTSIVGTYTAQAGGGAGKNYNAIDGSAMTAGQIGTMGNPGSLR